MKKIERISMRGRWNGKCGKLWRKQMWVEESMKRVRLLLTNEIYYDYHHKGNGIFDDCNGDYNFFEFVEPFFQHYLFLLKNAKTTKMAKTIMTMICTGIYLVFDFFHFQKKYKPTPDRAYTPMNIYIGFTLSPKRYAMRRLKPVLNYFSSFTNDDLITFLPSSNMMVRLALFPSAISVIVPSPKTLCLTLSPMSKFSIYFINLSMVFLPSSDSEKWEIIR